MADHKHVVVSKRLVAINSASSLIAKLVNVTVLLWTYQYLLKRIPAEEFAVLPVVTSIMVFAPLFFSFFTGGISRYAVDAYAKGEFDRVTIIVSSVMPLLLAASFVFFFGGALFAFNIEHIIRVTPEMVDSARVMLLLLVSSFCLQMIAQPFHMGFHIRQKFVELNLISIARDTLRIVMLLCLLLGIGPQVLWVVVASTVADAVHAFAVAVRSRILVPEMRFQPSFFAWAEARQLTSFGLWTTIGRLGGVMYTNAATILLNLYGTAVDVTSYHIGATFYRQIDTTIQLAAQPLQPTLTAMNALDDKARLARTVMRGGRYALWVTLAVAVPLTIFADSFVQLYMGGQYSQTATVIVLLMIIFPFTSPTALIALTAMAMAEVRAFFLPAFLFQFAGLLGMATILATTDLGAIGMALSLSVITIGSQLAYFWHLALRLTGLNLSDFVSDCLRPGLVPAAAGAVVWATLALNMQVESWAALLGYCFAGGVAYLVALFGFSLSPSERGDLGAVLRKLVGTRLR